MSNDKDKPSSIADKALSFGKSAIKNTLRSSLVTITGLTGDIKNYSVESVGKSFQLIIETAAKMVSTSKQVVNSAGQKADSTLDQLAGDPDKEEPLSSQAVRLALDFTPVIGDLKALGEARVKYKKSLTLTDQSEREALRHEARRDCLIISTIAAAKVATLPASGLTQFGLKAATKTLEVLNAGKAANHVTKDHQHLPTLKLDFLSPRADYALQYKPICETMDAILRMKFSSEKEAQIQEALHHQDI